MTLFDWQVFAWGDNDHGQQGNGGTSVNRRPTPVQGLDGVKITRIACGSSHSVAWTSPEPASASASEPVPFPSAKDPLGASAAGLTETFADGGRTCGGAPVKEARTSLSRALLSLSSLAAQQRALHYILQALRLQLCRDVIVAAFKQPSASDGAHFDLSDADRPDLHTLIEHKEIAALWELLKLSTTQGGELVSAQEGVSASIQSTLTDVLVG